MANIKASILNIRKIRTLTERNKNERSRLKTLSKKSIATITEGAESAPAVAVDYCSALDKAAKRNVIHKNKANRLKSKTAKRLAALASAKKA